MTVVYYVFGENDWDSFNNSWAGVRIRVRVTIDHLATVSSNHGRRDHRRV